MPATKLGIPAPAQVNTHPDGRYRFCQALEMPVRELTLPDIRASLSAALEDASRALRDRRHDDAAKYVDDARLLLRSLRRFEVLEERARLAGAR